MAQDIYIYFFFSLWQNEVSNGLALDSYKPKPHVQRMKQEYKNDYEKFVTKKVISMFNYLEYKQHLWLML